MTSLSLRQQDKLVTNLVLVQRYIISSRCLTASRESSSSL
ncbi:hypothetical protein, partial [Sodalis-like endosymbiont of Proechinophthirus fluctus]